MDWIKKFWEDDNGNPSSQRLQSTLLILAGILYAFIYQDPVVTGLIIGFGVGEKLGQKVMEGRK